MNRSRSEPYCLYCFAPLNPPQGVGVRCDSCGAHNLRVDLDKYWTREESLVRTQSILRGLTVVLTVVIAARIMLPFLSGDGGMHGFAGVGVAFAFPFLLGFLLWDACGLLTRRETVLRHDVVWPLLPMTLLVAPSVIVLLLLIVSSSWSSIASVGVLAAGGLAVGAILWLVIRVVIARISERRGEYLSRHRASA